ncbi:GNAT family N-acetyltransferase [Inediibacterium massiliense]|uniref:GNAT family N-acetyltransferase n=1 Tax=Inediibacterium massiliense TaxID=1658111 RepID=UPI0006B45225|nr:N-acetyltransferase [Inediibacterium massiliense]
MNIIIRQEKQDDCKQIYDLVKVAFQTAKVSNGKEQDFVNQLRSSDNYIPELALVAEENNVLIGHIMLTKSYISNSGYKTETLLLAPISVALEYRNKGVGSKLINKSFELAKDMGYKSIVLVGDTAYYSKFGFKKSVDFGIKYLHEIPEENVLACELVKGALDGVSGTIDC